MKVTVLLENATPSSRLIAKHGLSLLLESGERRVLFDMGPDGSFLRNAHALGVDVLSADAAVISHGHYDHGGGLGAFIEASRDRAAKAPVFVRQGAFGRHVSGSPGRHHDIGLDGALRDEPQVRVVAGDVDLGGGLRLFSCPKRSHPMPASNSKLYVRRGEGFQHDDFIHEQSLLVCEGGRNILVAGCSHAGILNILDRAEELAGAPIDVVVAGLHLTNPSGGTTEGEAATLELAREFARRKTKVYTFHCTGIPSFSLMRDVMGHRIEYLGCGSVREV